MMLGAALFLVGCTSDEYTAWLDPQGYDEENPTTVDITYAPTTIDYTQPTEETVQLFVPTVTVKEGAEVTYDVKVYSDDTNFGDIAASADGMVSASELKSLVWSLFGKVREQDETFEAALEITSHTLVDGVSVRGSGETTVTIVLPELLYSEFLYLPGKAQNWAPETAAAIHSPERDGKYTGYVYLDGGFKFTWARNWDDEYNYTSFTTYPDCMDNGDGSDTNIYCNEAGLYYLDVDVPNAVVQATKIENMNLVGVFNNWNPADATQQMTWNAAELCYEMTNAAVTDAGWKFTANNDWAINLGSNDTVEPSQIIDDLTGNGKNIGVAGTTIKLYPCRNTSDKIYATVE